MVTVSFKDRSCKLWNTTSGECLQTFICHGDNEFALATARWISQDASSVLTISAIIQSSFGAQQRVSVCRHSLATQIASLLQCYREPSCSQLLRNQEPSDVVSRSTCISSSFVLAWHVATWMSVQLFFSGFVSCRAWQHSATLQAFTFFRAR